MTREEKSYRILDLLGRPKERRDLGMSNLAKMKERELDVLLAELEDDTAIMADALFDWLKPDARRRLFDAETHARRQTKVGTEFRKPGQSGQD